MSTEEDVVFPGSEHEGPGGPLRLPPQRAHGGNSISAQVPLMPVPIHTRPIIKVVGALQKRPPGQPKTLKGSHILPI